MCGRWYLPIFLLRDGLFTLIYRASFMVLRRFWPSLPTISKLSMVTLWPEMVEWSWMGEGVLRCSLNLSAKFLADSPIYSSSQSTLLHLNLYMTPLFFQMVSLSFGAMRRFLMVSPPFRCTWTPYFLHVLLKFSLRPWWYGTTMWGWLILGCSGLVGLVPLLLFLLVSSFVFFIWILFRAQVGYLHFFKAEVRCCSSLFRCCGEEHMVLALCSKVPITLYFAGMLWWLSHCRYKSVWVGFLYTVVSNLPSFPGMMRMSKKGIEPSSLDSLQVNLMLLSMELRCCSRESLWAFLMIMKESSTNLFHSDGLCLYWCWVWGVYFLNDWLDFPLQLLCLTLF